MPFTPLTARKALLAALVKARAGSTTAPVPTLALSNIIDLLSEMEAEINALRDPSAPRPYADHATAALWQRRESLLRAKPGLTSQHQAELAAIEAELQTRKVLRIGGEF